MNYDEAAQAYRRGAVTMQQIAQSRGVTKQAVSKELRRRGVETRYTRYTPELIAALAGAETQYVNGAGLKDIAAERSVSAYILTRYLIECGVQIRPTGRPKKPARAG